MGPREERGRAGQGAGQGAGLGAGLGPGQGPGQGAGQGAGQGLGMKQQPEGSEGPRGAKRQRHPEAECTGRAPAPHLRSLTFVA
jgi:hypothetical protein